MKIAVVSKGDATAGGASRVAGDLKRTLAARGHEVHHFAAHTGRGDERSLYGGGVARRVVANLHKTARRAGFGELIPFEAPNAVNVLRGYDIVHFHDTSSAISPLTLSMLASRQTVAWTFHDCSPFTGGCIYPQVAGCDRYKTGCGSCPLIGEWPVDGFFDTTRLALHTRRSLLSSSRLGLIAPSEWMADVAMASGNVPARPTVISNMVDPETFRPAERPGALRSRLGLPADRPVFALSAGNISDRRKNVVGSLRALAHLASEADAPTVVLIGKADGRIRAELGGLDVVATGYVEDRAHLAEWLAASDAFVTTTRADNQPLAVMEAMACGVPVYSWAVGGVSTMIDDGIEGRLFAEQTVRPMGDRLLQDYRSGALRGMRVAARFKAVEAFSESKFAASHEAFYEHLAQRQGS
jgi:glycosyltransferase involved in cell wall biosynthesis